MPPLSASPDSRISDTSSKAEARTPSPPHAPYPTLLPCQCQLPFPHLWSDCWLTVPSLSLYFLYRSSTDPNRPLKHVNMGLSKGFPSPLEQRHSFPDANHLCCFCFQILIIINLETFLLTLHLLPAAQILIIIPLNKFMSNSIMKWIWVRSII